MFERFTANARFQIFYARYLATTFGSPWIEPEHMLLSLASKPLWSEEGEKKEWIIERFLSEGSAPEAVRQRIWDSIPKNNPLCSSVDLPMSVGIKRSISIAIIHQEELRRKIVYPEDLLYGILKHLSQLKIPLPAATILQESGVTVEAVEEYVSTLR